MSHPEIFLACGGKLYNSSPRLEGCGQFCEKIRIIDTLVIKAIKLAINNGDRFTLHTKSHLYFVGHIFTLGLTQLSHNSGGAVH